MKTQWTYIAVLTAILAACPCSNAQIASTEAHVVNISETMYGFGMPTSLQTWAVYVAFTSSGDSLLSTTQWNVAITGGTYFNLDPGPSESGGGDDPLALVVSGHVPVPPGIFGLPGYEPWRWDSNLSLDNSPASIPEPFFSWTDTLIGSPGGNGLGAGVHVVPPSPTAGDDLLVQVAQLTFNTGSPIVEGTFVALTPLGVAGVTVTTIHIYIPAPGAIALLGMAGLVGTRRRRA